jgi:hypothetical protein
MRYPKRTGTFSESIAWAKFTAKTCGFKEVVSRNEYRIGEGDGGQWNAVRGKSPGAYALGKLGDDNIFYIATTWAAL